MLTKSDLNEIKKLLKGFATKDDLKYFATRNDLKSLATKDDLLKVKKELKDDIFQFKDDILHEIIKLRDDVTIVTGYRDMIEDHDERIEKLEGKAFAD